MFNRGQAVRFETKFVVESCCNCGILFAMDADFERRRQDDGKYFYCPMGHPQHYTESIEQKLRQQLYAKDRDLEAKDRRLQIAIKDAQGEARLRRQALARINNGVCPKCKRSFTNVRRHMENKHPLGKKEANQKNNSKEETHD